MEVDRLEFKELVRAGVSEREIAEYFECSCNHVKYLKRTLNLSLRRAPKGDVQLPDAAALSACVMGQGGCACACARVCVMGKGTCLIV